MVKKYSAKHVLSTMALGMVGLLASSTLVMAASVVDLNDKNHTPGFFASEIDVVAGGTVLNNYGPVDMTAAFGFAASDNVTRYIRVDLDNGATFGALPTYFVPNGVVPPGIPTPVPGNVAAGGAGKSFVIFEVTAPTEGILSEGPGYIHCDTYKVINKNVVNATVRQYENASDAVAAGTNQLASVSGALIGWKNALVVKFDAVTPAKIDVSNNGNKFVAGGGSDETKTVIGDVDVTLVATDVPILASGMLADLPSILGTSTLTVSGDFSAAQTLPDGTYDKANVKLVTGTCAVPTTTVAEAETLAADAATFKFAAGEGIADDAIICLTVNGESLIAAGPYSANYVPVAVANYKLSSKDLGVISTLVKNGSTAVANLAMSPTTAFPSYVRVTNPSNIEGEVFFTLFLNDGTASAQFSLSAVSGQPATLAGQASTTPIALSDLFAASGLPADYTGNLRIQVDANTPSGDNGIVIKNISIAKDGSIFTTY